MRAKFAARLAATSVFLSGCALLDIGSSDLDRLKDAEPSGTAFQQAQFKDYAYLARSFGGAPSDQVEALANAYAAKALTAAGGDDVAPETPSNQEQSELHARLERGLNAGRDKAPADAARAQADYDCWILNQRIAAQTASSQQCRSSLEDTLAQLEGDVGA
jgi:OOP family OmpA-OmpF porin